MKLGVTYPFAPASPVPENTVRIPAGAVTVGIEYRSLTPDEILQRSQEMAAYPEASAELAAQAELARNGVDQGVSYHVWDSDSVHEYLRFDCFEEGRPHYHYIPKPSHTDPPSNRSIAFDTAANGPMWLWALEAMRKNLPAMLRAAGAEELAGRVELDQAALVDALDKAYELSQAVLSEHGHSASRPTTD